MKKLLLFLTIVGSLQITFAQPAGMLNEDFSLRSVETNDLFFTPNDENLNFRISEIGGIFFVETNGISNLFTAEAIFNGNTITLQNITITTNDCTAPACYYEDLYFYDILTTPTLDSKTFTYYYSAVNGYKKLSLLDANYNKAFFNTEPLPEPDPLLFQTWYLYKTEVDFGDPIFYTGPNQPEITINSDFTYTGVENCALISGNFIVGYGQFYDFSLQSENYQQDESNCPPGPVGYVLYDLMYRYPAMDCVVYSGVNGINEFQYETAAGFISYFSNQKLTVNENSLSTFTIFPNPVQNKFILQSSETNFTISITDINGRTITSNKNLVSNEIDVSALKTGMYFITVTSSEGKTSKKFIKN